MSFLSAVACALLFCVNSACAQSDQPGAPDLLNLFQRGSVELQAGAGIGAINSESYLLLLVGAGYYLEDGLSLGAAGEAWLGSQPEIGDVSPQIRYVFLNLPWRFKPYAGVFYRRTFFNRDYIPADSAGARVGLVFPLAARAYVTGGLVYESYFGRASYITGSEVYPEIGLSFAL